MRKAIKILAIIALAWILIGYAIAGLLTMSDISTIDMSGKYLEALMIGMMSPILTFIFEMGTGIYLLVLSKKRYGPAPEIVLLSVLTAVLPVCEYLLSLIYSSFFNKIIYMDNSITGYINLLNAMSGSIQYMNNGDFCRVGQCLLLVALSFAVAEKVVSKRHGTTLEEQYPSVDTIE